MSDLLREINDELKADKLHAFWREFQVPLITGVVALLLGVAGFNFWNHKQFEEKAASTSSVITALDQKDSSAALLKESGAEESPPIMLMLAAGEAAKTDSAKAITLYQRVIENKKTPDIMRKRAMLDSVLLGLNNPKNLAADKALADLKTIIDDNDMFVAEAHLLSGLIVKNLQKKPTESEAHFKAVVDDKFAPESLKERAKALLVVATLVEPK
jgi:hypothetical protein